MSKNKKSKKPFQGMEHLINNQEFFKQVEETPLNVEETPLNIVSTEKKSEKKSENISFNDNSREKFSKDSQMILKKELVSVVVLMSVLFLVLVGLMVYDTNYDGLSMIASKITDFLGK
ncbi:hypothetical protein IID19_03130 [Patescibacteria group bacterium]|nr:hypothetical protein [Patescibacteria group bacterium]